MIAGSGMTDPAAMKDTHGHAWTLRQGRMQGTHQRKRHPEYVSVFTCVY